MERLSDKKIMGIVALLVVLGAVLCALLVGRYLYTRAQMMDMMLDNSHLKVRVADTEAKRIKGLSGTKPLKEDEGMLFIFPGDGRHAIWMKDMRYALDIVWLDSEKKIIHIEQAVSPGTYPQTFAPPKPARYVVEVPSGYAVAHRLQAGQSAMFDR